VLAAGRTVAFGFSGTGSIADYTAAVAAQRAVLAQHPQLVDLVRYAMLAANGHNTQPWRFQADPRRIAILPDFSRRTPAVDSDDHHLFVSLGCTAENLALAATATGRRGELRFDPEDAIAFEFGAAPPERSALFDAIPKRQSTRADYDGRAVPAAARVPGIDLVLLTDRPRIERVLELVLTGNRAQMYDPAFMRKLKHWLRFNPRQALASSDGLYGPASGNPVLPGWLGGPTFELAFRVSSENDKYARQLRSSAAIAIFVSKRADKDHWVRTGRACPQALRR